MSTVYIEGIPFVLPNSRLNFRVADNYSSYPNGSLDKGVLPDIDLHDGFYKDKYSLDDLKQFIKEAKNTSDIDEQYAAFLFAHYVEVCCGCANTKGFKTLPEIYGGPYTQGWRCPQNDPNAKKFYPHKRSQAASKFLLKFNNPKDRLYWELTS